MAWHESDPSLIMEAFSYELHGDLDFEEARRQGDNRLKIRTKLQGRIDSLTSAAAVMALTFDGHPFGIYVAAGRSMDDHKQFIRTDDALYRQAHGYLTTWLRPNPYHLSADPGQDVPELSSFHYQVVAKGPEGPVLAPHDYVGDDGTLLFDNVAFWRNLDKAPFVKASTDWHYSEPALSSNRVRDEVAEAMRAAVPAHLRSAVVNELGGQESDEYRRWTGVVLATDEGTYLIGLEPWQLKRKGSEWRERVAVTRIGGPEMFDDYAPAAGAPRP